VNDRVLGSPVLITGATGFAGSHLIESLSGTSRLAGWGRSVPRPEFASLAEWTVIDLLDRKSVQREIATLRPAMIFHLAGSPQVAESWQDSTRPLAGNVLATAHLFDAIRRADLTCRVLVAGSGTVYAPSESALNETSPLAPANPYALSKLAQEQMALRAFSDDGLEIVMVRAFNHTGPRQSPSFVAPSMARQIALIEAGQLEPVMRVGNLDSRRDFSDVRDIVRAYVAVMKLGKAGEIYNVGSGTGRTIRSLLDALRSRSRVHVRVETDPQRLRPVETAAAIADTSRLRAQTRWQPQVSFESMLEDVLDYWRTEVRRLR
jgi:GDP-4-dehydro-6-deoxy-D-mannose reductase